MSSNVFIFAPTKYGVRITLDKTKTGIVNYLKAEEVIVSSASEKDMPVIEHLAKKFDLNCEDLSWKQFVVAKNKETIIGFGRLLEYPGCAEIATLGVIPEERKCGVGSLIVKELIRLGPSEIFAACVIPDFFHKLGFQIVKEYPSTLQKKVDFCKLYGFKDEEIFVMKMEKKEK